MATAEALALVTIEQYAAMPDEATRSELVEGRIIEVPPPRYLHGRICARISRLIGNHVADEALGEVVTNDSGIITRRDPDTVRGADVAFYSAPKVPPSDQVSGYPAIPPDLVVEVPLTSDRWADLLTKAAEYLAAGVLVVVVLDPDTRSAHVFEADRPNRVLGPDDVMTFPDLLGDFAVVVGRIFD